MQDKVDPLRMLLVAFGLASFGGVAALLRSNQVITLRSFLSACTYSGLAGLVVSLLWFRYFDDEGNIYFLLGVAALAGVGGSTVLDFLLQSLLRTLRAGGLSVTFGPPMTGADAPPLPNPQPPLDPPGGGSKS